jgi:hypothetical protein
MADHYDTYKHVSFLVPLTKEQADWAERLFDACDEALMAFMQAGRSDSEAIYNKVEFVPADLAEPVKRIDPCRGGIGEGVLLSYEEESYGGDGLWICDSQWVNVEFIAAWLKEIMRKFDIDDEWGFQWSLNCSSPSVVHGGGACIVTKDETKWNSTTQWLESQVKVNKLESPVPLKGSPMYRSMMGSRRISRSN